MREQRRIERHQLPFYLRVFNAITDKPIGSIGNVSADGLLLVSELPMLVGSRFDLRLKLPGQGEQLRCIDFQADCQWSREDVTPGTFDSGFALVAPPVEYLQAVDSLVRYFSFANLPASP